MNVFFVATIFALLGLIIGSFLNVVILRLEQNMTLGGRSMCPRCHGLIHWYDNIPLLSFLLLRGKCRQCRTRISWQYPFVEGTTAVLFAIFGTITIGDGGARAMALSTWCLFLIAILVTIAVYDARNMEIPLILLLIGISGAIVYAVMGTLFSGGGFFSPSALWKEMIWGGSIAALFFYGLVYYSKETWMGMGDVWLGGIAGAAVGLPALLLLLTLSFFVGALVGGGMLFLGKKGMRSQIPFAPFLSLGTLTTLFLVILHPWWLSFLLLPLV